MTKVKNEIENSEDIEEKAIEKAAEIESLETEKTREDLKKSSEESLETEKPKNIEKKKKELLEKAKKLAEKVDVAKTEDLKEQIKLKKRTEMLIPLEEYVKAGIYLGTQVVTPMMRQFVYRRRADGLAIFNTDLIDEKLKEAIEFLIKFDAKEIILICKREAGWKAAEMFGELTGIRVFSKKYPAGILTNIRLPTFFENEMTIITDQWIDKNALNDTLKVHKKVLMICDTNNFSRGSDIIIIGNNKSPKSLGLIFYVLTKGYCEKKGIDANIPKLEEWVGEEEEEH